MGCQLEQSNSLGQWLTQGALVIMGWRTDPEGWEDLDRIAYDEANDAGGLSPMVVRSRRDRSETRPGRINEFGSFKTLSAS